MCGPWCMHLNMCFFYRSCLALLGTQWKFFRKLPPSVPRKSRTAAKILLQVSDSVALLHMVSIELATPKSWVYFPGDAWTGITYTSKLLLLIEVSAICSLNNSVFLLYMAMFPLTGHLIMWFLLFLQKCIGLQSWSLDSLSYACLRTRIHPFWPWTGMTVHWFVCSRIRPAILPGAWYKTCRKKCWIYLLCIHWNTLEKYFYSVFSFVFVDRMCRILMLLHTCQNTINLRICWILRRGCQARTVCLCTRSLPLLPLTSSGTTVPSPHLVKVSCSDWTLFASF